MPGEGIERMARFDREQQIKQQKRFEALRGRTK